NKQTNKQTNSSGRYKGFDHRAPSHLSWRRHSQCIMEVCVCVCVCVCVGVCVSCVWWLVCVCCVCVCVCVCVCMVCVCVVTLSINSRLCSLTSMLTGILGNFWKTSSSRANFLSDQELK